MTSSEAQALADRIRNNTDLIATDFSLAARSVAYFWSKNVTNARADNLVEVNPPDFSDVNTGTAQHPHWVSDPYTTNITRRIASYHPSFDDRYNWWNDNVGYAYTGGNPYESMRDVLNRVGIQSVNATSYESQFGISLGKRTPVEIGGSNHALMVESIKNESAVPTDIVLAEPMQALLTEAKNTLGFNEGEYIMLVADIPNTPPSMSAAVMLVQADSDKQIPKAGQLHSLGICMAVNPLITDQADMYPVMDVNSYMSTTKQINYIDEKTATITILQQPKHGYLEPTMQDGDWTHSRYLPNDDFLGNDSFVMQIDGNGYKVELHYFVAVVEGGRISNPVCKGENKGFIWKISTAPNAAPTTTNLYIPTDAADSLSLPVSFLGIDYTTPTITFTNLTGAAVGSTQGKGADATITLDTDAAGIGWYIDYTPYLNEAYLPTSNANEWLAKAGSDAEGKMDMLSVLLHEYGHALGLEHSQDTHDFMGATLTPGVRRLPSAEELTRMAQLAAEAKQNLAGLDGATVSGNGTNPLPSPIPTVPLGAGFGITFLGLTRRNNSSAGSQSSETVVP